MTTTQKSKVKSRPTEKLGPKDIRLIQILRSNGLTYKEISATTKFGYGTVQKYAKSVAILPKIQQNNPFDLINIKKSGKRYLAFNFCA